MITELTQPPLIETRTDTQLGHVRVDRKRAPVVLALVGAATATSVALGGAGFVPQWIEFPGTSISPVSSLLGGEATTIPASHLLRRIRLAANLTWDQIARIFGVSRRSVHNWAAGEKLSAQNMELLAALDGAVARVQGGTADEKRIALFTPNEIGISPIDAIRQKRDQAAIVNPRVADPSALLDA